MSASSTMQKGFIFLLIIWNSSFFASGKTAENHLQLSLGCEAVIPCQHNKSGSVSFKWLYEKDGRSNKIQIFFEDKTGVQHLQQVLRPRMKVLRDGSLVIDNFTEEDEGLYWCENCIKDNCWNKYTRVTSVKKGILKETNKTFYVTAGSNFIHACPGELTNLKWTFEVSNMTALRESHFVTSNKSIHILNVKRADAGKYICWTSGCNGHVQKLLTINLCVITVHHREDSSVSCAVVCDMEFSKINPNSTSNVTDTRTGLVDAYGDLNCSTKQTFDGYSTVNCTLGPSNAYNKTDIPPEPEYLIPVIYGTSATLTCLILMALLICYLRPRLWAAFPIYVCCCGLNGRVEEETSVIYSSIVIRRPAKITNNHMTYSECVYSEINV